MNQIQPQRVSILEIQVRGKPYPVIAHGEDYLITMVCLAGDRDFATTPGRKGVF
jgi:hypothetical protein